MHAGPSAKPPIGTSGYFLAHVSAESISPNFPIWNWNLELEFGIGNWNLEFECGIGIRKWNSELEFGIGIQN